MKLHDISPLRIESPAHVKVTIHGRDGLNYAATGILEYGEVQREPGSGKEHIVLRIDITPVDYSHYGSYDPALVKIPPPLPSIASVEEPDFSTIHRSFEDAMRIIYDTGEEGEDKKPHDWPKLSPFIISGIS